MGYCKICDILFCVFLMFAFVLYVNPKAFSAKAIEEARASNAQYQKQLEAQRELNAKIYACINQTNIDLSRRLQNKAGAYTLAVKEVYSFKNGQCEKKTSEYYLDGWYN
ncbi:hypothetical protein G7032_17050 [Pseudomonas monteilii]|uniref:hypothetical protein n=1 Tax=Pseudomonas monteilii TaxID=76759 RepID=UPI0015E3736A|nr:hypothetical protein [Pseudomonas monteilii]MBA1317555.1 hypothetical protein [Pseudomonas monteilii]